MSLPVSYSIEARQDLRGLFRYIATESPSSAKSYTAELAQHCMSLGAFPEMGRLRDDLGAGIRSFSFRRRQVIIYEILPDRVEILRIFSAGQDVEALLGE